jgi:hypothetical protein
VDGGVVGGVVGIAGVRVVVGIAGVRVVVGIAGVRVVVGIAGVRVVVGMAGVRVGDIHQSVARWNDARGFDIGLPDVYGFEEYPALHSRAHSSSYTGIVQCHMRTQ